MWLSKAISYAEQAEAHKYSRPNGSNRDMLDKKRLWWCCILRDRMIAIGVRRGIQITSNKFDFEEPGLSEEDLAGEVNGSQVYTPETKRLLVQTIVAQCALAAAMTPTMTAIYRANNFFSQTPTVSQLVTSMAEIAQGNTELRIWARRYKAGLTERVRTGKQHPALDAPVTVFADMTMIYY